MCIRDRKRPEELRATRISGTQTKFVLSPNRPVHYAICPKKSEEEEKHVFTNDDTQSCVLLDSYRRLALIEPTSACSESLWFNHRCCARRHRRYSSRSTDCIDQPGPGHRGSSNNHK